MQRDQRTQGRGVGGIGRDGGFQRLFGRRRIVEILLVPARYGHQHVGALGLRRHLGH
jgi:hypothetical protein